jgi:rhodanese-related sulfurtransferase
MKQLPAIILRSALIVFIWAAIGLGVNAMRPAGLPWIYVPKKELSIAGLKVPLVDEKGAARFLNDPETVFVDTRPEKDYRERHVKSAVFLPADDTEERFVMVQGLMPEDSRIILYCYGPECDMAEKVGQFLAKNGYTNMMIMTAGFRAWEKAGYPVEGEGRKSELP